MNTNTLLLASSIILLLAGAMFGVFIWAEPSNSMALRANDATIVARGKQIYTRQCAACHGANLQGQPNWQDRNAQGKLPAPPHDPSGHTWHHGDKVLFELTRSGPQKFTGTDYKTDMPAYGGIISDDDIIAVLSYIKSTWPADIQKRHDLLNASLKRQEAQN